MGNRHSSARVSWCTSSYFVHKQKKRLWMWELQRYSSPKCCWNRLLTKVTTRAANETNIKFDNEPLAVVQRFTYLGSVLNERTNLDCEIRSRINAASGFFWKLRERVFDNHDPSLSTKLVVYRAVVIPPLLYGCESWVTYSRHVKDLQRIQQRHLRCIIRIRWFHYIPN